MNSLFCCHEGRSSHNRRILDSTLSTAASPIFVTGPIGRFVSEPFPLRCCTCIFMCIVYNKASRIALRRTCLSQHFGWGFPATRIQFGATRTGRTPVRHVGPLSPAFVWPLTGCEPSFLSGHLLFL